MPIRADRLPWETTPYVDGDAASGKAIAAAQGRSTDPKSPVVVSYAQRAFDLEIALVRNPPAGFNDQLFKSGANLYELVAAGALDETVVERALRDAMRDNGYERDKGENAVTGTLNSARRTGFDNPRDLSGVGLGTVAYLNGSGGTLAAETPPPGPVTLESVFALEQGFWTLRESLQNIYLGALNRMCSPWAVLGFCVARALALIPPNATLPPTVSGPGSLNWLCAIAAKSGGGKSGAGTVARELVRQTVRTRNLGSGEGLVDSYMRPAKKDTGEPAGVYESVMFVADESDMLRALSARSGSTLSPTLRSAFTGETLGTSNRTASSLHLEAHTYRMTLVCGIQPGKAGTLLDDVYGGTLQRFMWFPAEDSRVTTEKPPMPGALEIMQPGTWQYPRELGIPYEAIALIEDERVRFMQGAGDPLAAHSLFIREKFAYALCVLDGRDEMALEDWRLAGIAMRVSDQTRAWVVDQLKLSEEEEDAKTGRRRGVAQFAAKEEEAQQGNRIMLRMTGWAAGKVRAAGTVGIKNRDLVNGAKSPDRRWLKAALEGMRNDGLLRFDEKKSRWFEP